jgi:hypothetical protein
MPKVPKIEKGVPALFFISNLASGKWLQTVILIEK